MMDDLSAAGPLLSIVTPSLNQGRYLAQALGSVAGQTAAGGAGGGAVEHLVVDGGSTDGSVGIIAAHAAGGEQGGLAWWVSEADRGQSEAINKGFARARGRYGGWLNADDWYEPGALAGICARLRADPSVDVLVGRCRFIGEDGRVAFAPTPPDPIVASELLRLKSRWFNGRSLVQPEVFFRLDLFRQVGGLNVENHYTMDYELWLRLLAAGARFVSIDLPVADLRVHPAQKTSRKREVARSILGVATGFVREHGAAMAGSSGADIAGVEGELGSMTRKLAVGDALRERWGEGATPTRERSLDEAAVSVREYYAWAAGHEDEWSEARRQVAARTAGAAWRRAAWAMLGRRSLRVLEFGCGTGRGVEGVLRRFGRKRLDVAACDASPEMLGRCRARVAGVADERRHRVRFVSATTPRVSQVAEMAPFDVVVTESVLLCFSGPSGLLRELCGLLRPGGVYMQLSEPRAGAGEALGAYLAAIRGRLDDQLTMNDETVLDPSADPFLSPLEAERESGLGAGAWCLAHPSCRGVDVERALGAACPEMRPVMRRAFGGFDHHPLAPFPTQRWAIGMGADGWFTSVWRKPG